MSAVAEARRKLRHASIEAGKKPLVPPGATSTTTPAGIAANARDVDPEAWANRQRAAEFAGEQEPAKANGKHQRNGHAGDDEPAVAWQELPEASVAAIEIGQFERHPDNRHPLEHDVLAMMQSLLEVHQLEAIVAWQPTPKGKLQILSGETRWLAARRLGWPTIQARIVTGIDRGQALQLLARYNGERKDLDPIQRARLGRRLCSPIDQGGAGLTQQKAAEQLGLEKGASLANLLKLLELPDKWQTRVAAGELAWTWARELMPGVTLAPVEKAMEAAWKEKDKPRRWGHETRPFDSRALLVDAIRESIDNDCRRVFEDEHGRPAKKPLVDASSPAIREQFGIVEVQLPDGGRGKTTTVCLATNIDAWEEMCETRRERADKRRAERSDRDDEPKRELSAAEQKQRAADRARQLSERIAAWRHDWLKELVAAEIEHREWTASGVKLLIWIQLSLAGDWKSKLDAKMEAAIKTAGGKVRGLADRWGSIESVGGVLNHVMKEYLQAVVLHEDRDARQPLIPHEVLDQVASDYGIDLADRWGVMQAGREASARFEAFFLLHQSDQLDALGDELGVYTRDAASKAAKVKLFTTRERTLQLPKSIKPLAGERRPSKPKVRKGTKS